MTLLLPTQGSGSPSRTASTLRSSDRPRGSPMPPPHPRAPHLRLAALRHSPGRGGAPPPPAPAPAGEGAAPAAHRRGVPELRPLPRGGAASRRTPAGLPPPPPLLLLPSPLLPSPPSPPRCAGPRRAGRAGAERRGGEAAGLLKRGRIVPPSRLGGPANCRRGQRAATAAAFPPARPPGKSRRRSGLFPATPARGFK